jgi:hypothetical protein
VVPQVCGTSVPVAGCSSNTLVKQMLLFNIWMKATFTSALAFMISMALNQCLDRVTSPTLCSQYALKQQVKKESKPEKKKDNTKKNKKMLLQ